MSTQTFKIMTEESIKNIISYTDFAKVDIRVGKVIDIQNFPEARNPAYKLKIDFGPDIGIKKSSAQITSAHTKEALLGQLVICVVNFAPKQVGPFVSEVLTLGFPFEKGGYKAVTVDVNGIKLGDKLA